MAHSKLERLKPYIIRIFNGTYEEFTDSSQEMNAYLSYPYIFFSNGLGRRCILLSVVCNYSTRKIDL